MTSAKVYSLYGSMRKGTCVNRNCSYSMSRINMEDYLKRMMVPTCPKCRANTPLPLFDIFSRENRETRKELRGEEDIRGLIKPDITFFDGDLYQENEAKKLAQKSRTIEVEG